MMGRQRKILSAIQSTFFKWFFLSLLDKRINERMVLICFEMISFDLLFILFV